MTEALSPLDIFQATAMLLSDRPPHRTHAVFFHARSRGDDDELFALAWKLICNDDVSAIVINGSQGEAYGKQKPGEAWVGADVYKGRLEESLPNRLKGRVICSRPAFHTREEASAFLEVAQEHGWTHAIILTLPHHMPRAFLSMVHAMECDGYRLRVYAAAPMRVNWRLGVPGSQGVGMLARRDHIAGELERIARYQASGELATFKQLHTYLQWRDD